MTELQSKKIISENENQADQVEQFFAPEKKKSPAKRKRRSPKKLLEPELLIKEDLKKVGFFSRPVLISGMVVSLLLVLGVAGGFISHQRSLLAEKNRTENESYLYKIKDLVYLQEDEEPTIATVSDKEKLKDQAFFASAENGDKVVLFSKAQKIVLFRPSANKIVEIASLSDRNSGQPLVAAEPETQSESQVLGEETSETAGPVRVAVYNGAFIKGLAQATSEKVLELEGTEAGILANASGNYSQTIVIDLKGGQESKVQEIIALVGGEAGSLPEGEDLPEADILIIVGKDQSKP